jgi:large subunit ribosomal protein L25
MRRFTLNMGNKYTLLKFPAPDFKIMHPDNTVICQVKISCFAMKAAQGCKKAPAKGKKK